MHGQMPQEIEVWYVIPALRRELAKVMIKDFKLTQKKVAACMGITEAAVSQYLSLKRAKEVLFGKEILAEIKKSAKKVVADNSLLIPEIIRLCKLTQVKRIMCGIHKRQDAKLPASCDICFEREIEK
ncbi:transcriptional regulator [Candidatus Woesearchaeota archaeon]|nr:transcriptional regulator [Candidatus Woesearchaeota archaeon]